MAERNSGYYGLSFKLWLLKLDSQMLSQEMEVSEFYLFYFFLAES